MTSGVLQFFAVIFGLLTIATGYGSYLVGQTENKRALAPDTLASQTLKWTLESALSQLKTGSLSSENQGALFSVANGGRFDDEDKATLYEIYSLITASDINDNNGRKMMLKVTLSYILLQYPDFSLSDPEVLYNLLDGKLSQALSSNTNEETKQHYIRLGIDQINQEGGFNKQVSFTDLHMFFPIAFANEEDSTFIYNLVTSEQDKRYIYETFYLPHMTGIPTSNDYWKTLLDAEFP